MTKKSDEKKNDETKRDDGGRVLRRETEELPVKLTETEKATRGLQLAELYGEIESHEAKATEVKATLKAERAALEAKAQKIGMVIRQGHELRPVEVSVVAYFGDRRVVYERADTNETIRARALTDAERQSKLFADEAGAPAPKTAPAEKTIGKRGSDVLDAKQTAKARADQLFNTPRLVKPTTPDGATAKKSETVDLGDGDAFLSTPAPGFGPIDDGTGVEFDPGEA